MQVEQLLRDKGIYFKRAGKDLLVHCLNPKHDDSNPSMRVDRLTGGFHCFACSFKGNLFSHFGEAINLVDIRVQQMKEKIGRIRFNEVLIPLGAEPFKQRYRNISVETYAEFGAFLHNDFDGRILFPITDISGKIHGMIGRLVFSDQGAKYLVYPSGVDLPLFPAKINVYRDSLILVEGIFDFLNLYDKGLRNVVCLFGKSMGDSKKKHVRYANRQKFMPIKIQGVKKVYVLFDDGAEKSADNMCELLDDLFIMERVSWPKIRGDKDPGNLTLEEVQELKEYIYESGDS